jgi:LAS superfamily LD-carboxypeptidase LdcB
VWVSGPGGSIQIHKSLSTKLGALLNAAGADGIALGGSGYRGSERQIELRRQNCGSSDYAIHKMPPFSCRPPTALPGSSNHERGLAVDFSVNGVMLSRGSAGYGWLARNAARFGFYNLPSEAWHWSYDGN